MNVAFFKIQTICFVCSRVIKGKNRYIGSGKYRCEKCKPGSARWMRSSVGKKSEVREFFLVQTGSSGNDDSAERDDKEEILWT